MSNDPTEGSNNLIYLDRQTVDCGPAKFLTSFHHSRNPAQLNVGRYSYTCCQPRPSAQYGPVDCTDHVSSEGNAVYAGHTFQLDGVALQCPPGKFMQRFNMQHRASGKLGYDFRCCSIGVLQ